MAKEIKTTIIINATPEKIWNILMDFKMYPNWNPFIKSISGSAQEGSTITARMEPPNANGMTFKPKVLLVNKNKEFKWCGQLLMPGIFTGEHRFQILDNGNQTCTFIQSEKFTGILIPFFKKMLEVNTVEGFNLMNQKLKELSEQKPI